MEGISIPLEQKKAIFPLVMQTQKILIIIFTIQLLQSITIDFEFKNVRELAPSKKIKGS